PRAGLHAAAGGGAEPTARHRSPVRGGGHPAQPTGARYLCRGAAPARWPGPSCPTLFVGPMTGASVGQHVWPEVESSTGSTTSDTQMERCSTQGEGGEDMAEQDRRVTRRIGPLDIAWPR